MPTLPDGYWTVLEPAFAAVSIYEGHRVYSKQVSKFPMHVRNLLAAHWCESEVFNGGLNQFFWNSTGVLALDAIIGFRALGLRVHADIVNEATARFGPKYPTAREPRQRRLDARRKADRVDCSDLDAEFYAALDAVGGFHHVANAYAERCHAEALAKRARGRAKKPPARGR